MESTLSIASPLSQAGAYSDMLDHAPTQMTPCNQAYPLRLAREGECLKITQLQGGSTFQDRLAGMGLLPGVTIQVLSNGADGKLLISCNNTRLFLGGGMAHKILVVPQQEASA